MRSSTASRPTPKFRQAEPALKVFFTVANADLAAVEALFEGRHGRAFKNGDGEHPPAIEVYRGRRYFTVTEESIGPHDDLRLVDLADLRWLICEAGPKFSRQQRQQPGHDAARPKPSARAQRSKQRASAMTTCATRLLSHKDPEIAEWARTKGLDNGERELRRIFDKAGGDEPAVRLRRLRRVHAIARLRLHARRRLLAGGSGQRPAAAGQAIRQERPADRR